MASDLRKRGGALGQIRTADTRFRRAVLYPLSYEGGAWPELAARVAETSIENMPEEG